MPNKKKRTIPTKSFKKPKKSAKKTTPKRKVARRRPAAKRSSLARNKKFSAKRKRVTSTGLVVEAVPLPSGQRPHLGGQAAGLQGLSTPPTANSESVGELLEEGNAVEAEDVQGVKNALNVDEDEVESGEAAEDDIPEYLE